MPWLMQLQRHHGATEQVATAVTTITLASMIDLHIHSTASDGTLSPGQLAVACAEAGISGAALTDHDTVAGLPEFLSACAEVGVEGIPGVELSASWYGGSLHILGLAIDASCGALIDLLHEVQLNRGRRNAGMAARLAEAGVAVSTEELAREAGGEVVGRPHFASILVRKGVCRNRREAFERWLGNNCPCYIRRFLPLPKRVIAVIHEAGGKAIVAHPFGSPQGTAPSRVRKIVRQLVGQGLDGIEAYYSDHSPLETQQALALAEEFGLLITGGSDFHGATMPGIELGRGRGELKIPDCLLRRLVPQTPGRVKV